MTSRFRWEFIYLLISFAMTLTVAGWSVASLMPGRKTDAAVDSLESVIVCRDDLDTTLLAGGDLQPTKQATVTCQVEDVTDSDGTMVLSVIENGAAVKKGMSSAGSILGDSGTGTSGRNSGQPGASILFEGSSASRRRRSRSESMRKAWLRSSQRSLNPESPLADPTPSDRKTGLPGPRRCFPKGISA